MHALERIVVLLHKSAITARTVFGGSGWNDDQVETAAPWLPGGANLRKPSAVHYAIPCETHYTIRLRSEFRLPSPPPYSPVREFIP